MYKSRSTFYHICSVADDPLSTHNPITNQWFVVVKNIFSILFINFYEHFVDLRVNGRILNEDLISVRYVMCVFPKPKPNQFNKVTKLDTPAAKSITELLLQLFNLNLIMRENSSDWLCTTRNTVWYNMVYHCWFSIFDMSCQWIVTGYSSISHILPSFADRMNEHDNNIRIDVSHSTVIIIKFPQGTL